MEYKSICPLRHWNRSARKNELWVYVEVDRVIPVSIESATTIRTDISSIIGRMPSVAIPSSRHLYHRDPGKTNSWLVGPVTEQEADVIRKLSLEPSQ